MELGIGIMNNVLSKSYVYAKEEQQLGFMHRSWAQNFCLNTGIYDQALGLWIAIIGQNDRNRRRDRDGEDMDSGLGL